MIYIFEGCDLSGKSFLAEKLSKELDVPLVKKPFNVINVEKGTLKGNQIEVFTHFFWESIFQIGKQSNLIVDRSLLSSLVFSKMFKRNYDLKYIYSYLIEKDLKQFIKIFLITTDKDTLKDRYLIRSEKFFSLEELFKIQELYITFAEHLRGLGAEIIYVNNSKSKENQSLKEIYGSI